MQHGEVLLNWAESLDPVDRRPLAVAVARNVSVAVDEIQQPSPTPNVARFLVKFTRAPATEQGAAIADPLRSLTHVAAGRGEDTRQLVAAVAAHRRLGRRRVAFCQAGRELARDPWDAPQKALQRSQLGRQPLVIAAGHHPALEMGGNKLLRPAWGATGRSQVRREGTQQPERGPRGAGRADRPARAGPDRERLRQRQLQLDADRPGREVEDL